MKATRLAAAIAVGYFGGEAAATQYLAHRYHCAPQLGQPVVSVGGQCLFPPTTWNEWSDKLRKSDSSGWHTANLLSLSGLGAGVAWAAMFRGQQSRNKQLDAYGTARWAQDKELSKQGLMSNHGVVLSQTRDAEYEGGNATTFGSLKRAGTLLIHDGPQHVLMYAPTRSGKGVSAVIPTLLVWNGSALVYDLKGSNYEATAGYRSTFSHCLKFNPTQRDSVGINPLLEVRAYPYDVRDVQEIGSILVNPDPSAKGYSHWKETGSAFLVAVMLHVLYAGNDRSLPGVMKTLSRPLDELLDEMIETRHFDSGPHPAVSGGARLMKSRDVAERSSILSTAASFLEIFKDPIVAEITSRRDFTIADLTCCENPTTLYLVVPANDRERSMPLMRLMYTMITNRQMEGLQYVPTSSGRRKRKHALLDLRDEFVAPGAFPGFDTYLATCAEYRIKCFLIVQSKKQLDETYGRLNSIAINCHTSITYAVSDYESAEMISRTLGTQTLERTQQSHSRRVGELLGGSRSETKQQYGRPLLFPAEVQTLPFHDSIVISDGVPPALCTKVSWWQHPGLRDRGYNSRTGKGPKPPTSPEELRAELPPASQCHWLVELGKPGAAGSMEQPPENGGAGAQEEEVFHSEVQLREEEAAIEESWGHL